MGCLCKKEQPPAGERVAAPENRKCRDVIFLLFFIAFWVGMFIICGVAFDKGDPKYITNGIDMFGFLCGTKNTVNDIEVDLTDAKYLYYLDPFELLDPTNLPYAKSICVASCPTAADLCEADSLPCKNNTQYRCPYYEFEENGLYGTLQNTGDLSTAYFEALATTSETSCLATESGIPGFYSEWEEAFVSSSSGAQLCGQYAQLTSQFPGKGPCYAVWTETFPWFNRCIPSVSKDLQDRLLAAAATSVNNVASSFGAVSDSFDSSGSRLRRYISDIPKAMALIAISGLAGGLVLSVLWMVLLRIFAGVMVWLTVVVANVLFLGCTLFSWSKAGYLSKAGEVGKAIAEQLPDMADPSSSDRTVWLVVAIIMSVLTVLLIVFTLFMISRLRIAIATMKVAGQAIGTMPSILFFPLLPFALTVALLFYWIAVTGYLYSAGTVAAVYKEPNSGGVYALDVYTILGLTNSASASAAANAEAPSAAAAPRYATNTTEGVVECAYDQDCYFDLTWNKRMQYAFIYHFFGLLWTSQFIAGFGYVTVAGAIAHFYWTRGDRSRMPALPVLSAMKNTVVYHLGSVAIGSFIIAVIMFIRAILAYIDRKLKSVKKESRVVKYLMACLQCCMWCIEKIMRFINKNTYIIVGVKGTSYCTSAATAIKLIVTNALRLLAVHAVGDAVIWLGKVAVTCGCGLIAFLISDMAYYTDPLRYPDTYLSSPLLPVLVAAIIGYVVADIFLSVYEFAVATILLCFCEDCDEHGNVPQYAPPLLMEAIGRAEEHAAKSSAQPMQPAGTTQVQAFAR